MGMSKHEIATKLKNEQEILEAVRERLQQLELREARQGFNTPPEVVTEIREYTERAQRHEAEIQRLRTLAVTDTEPLADIEYRKLLAEEWDIPQARPTVAGDARLRLARLRLGVPTERAKELEHEVRVALAEEAFYKSELNIGFVAFAALNWSSITTQSRSAPCSSILGPEGAPRWNGAVAT